MGTKTRKRSPRPSNFNQQSINKYNCSAIFVCIQKESNEVEGTLWMKGCSSYSSKGSNEIACKIKSPQRVWLNYSTQTHTHTYYKYMSSYVSIDDRCCFDCIGFKMFSEGTCLLKKTCLTPLQIPTLIWALNVAGLQKHCSQCFRVLSEAKVWIEFNHCITHKPQKGWSLAKTWAQNLVQSAKKA